MAKRKSKEQAKIKKQPKENNVLERVDYLEISLNQMEMESLKKDLSNMGLTIDNHEMQKQRAILQRNDIKNKIQLLKSRHEMFMEKLKKEKGIDIKGKIIKESIMNPETYEIIDG